ncbi:MAG: anti-phage deoxyguanosine triphosphatase [Legionella sp.]|nr:anti-phage deoxyguanosine triphosphatase [Legionella sp.]
MEHDDWCINRLKNRTRKAHDHRSAYEKDRCKVVHSYAFRRLQGKIQVVSGIESDFHRNRLTHSIEVASIAKSIYCNIRERRRHNTSDEPLQLFFEHQDKSDIESLLFTIGLLHDIGHPPLGHGGEYALNYKMHKFGGFEGNAQTLRLITTISPLNLTYRTLLGTLKYPVNYTKLVNLNAYPIEPDRRATDSCQISTYLINRNDWAPPKCYYDIDEHIVSEMLQYLNESDKERFQSRLINVDGTHNQSIYKTFDCSIMDIADDISYSIHDLEDAIFFNQIKKDDLDEFFSNQKFISEHEWQKYPKQLLAKDLNQRKKIISKLVHSAIINTGVFIRTDFSEPLLKYYVDFENDLLKDFIQRLKKIVRKKLIETQHVKSIIHGGMVVIMQLFDAFLVNPDLLPTTQYEKIKKADANSENYRRVIADYISGMTDQYLFKMHQRIFGANNQNTFDII